MQLAWGKKVSSEFKARVIDIADELMCDPNYLMACMAFETAETFRPDIKNPRSTATGLIQFMSYTAKNLGTTTEALAKMTAVEQLDWVRLYFLPYQGRLKTLADVYMTILWPKAVGRPDSYVVFREGSAAYVANRGLDANRDGQITKAECAIKVHAKLIKGLSEHLRG